MEPSWGTGPLVYVKKMTNEEIDKVESVFAEWMKLDDHKFEKTPDDIAVEIAKWDSMKKDCFALQEKMEKSYTTFCTVVLTPLAKIK